MKKILRIKVSFMIEFIPIFHLFANHWHFYVRYATLQKMLLKVKGLPRKPCSKNLV